MWNGTLFVASGEDDSSSIITDEALGDESGFEVTSRGGSRFVYNGVGGQNLSDQGVTVGSRFELIHFGEDRFSLWGLVHFLLSRIGSHWNRLLWLQSVIESHSCVCDSYTQHKPYLEEPDWCICFARSIRLPFWIKQHVVSPPIVKRHVTLPILLCH